MAALVWELLFYKTLLLLLMPAVYAVLVIMSAFSTSPRSCFFQHAELMPAYILFSFHSRSMAVKSLTQVINQAHDGILVTLSVCMQIKSIWSVLLRGFEFELVDQFPEPDFESMVVGPKPCRVHFKRRKQPL